MAQKSETSAVGPQADWESDADDTEYGVLPEDNPNHAPWRPGERVRVLTVAANPDAPGGGQVWLVARAAPDLCFRLEVTPAGEVVGFHVRPLVFRVTRTDAMIWSEPDDISVREGAAPLSARLLRSLPVGELSDAAVAGLRNNLAWLLLQGAERSRWADTFAAEHRPGRRKRPDRFYAEVAAEYVGGLGSGGAAAVADARGLSVSQVRSLLYEARRRDLLTPAPRGREGGSLTTKAQDLLAQTEES